MPGSTHDVKHLGILLVQGGGCAGDGEGSDMKIGVIELRVFIGR